MGNSLPDNTKINLVDKLTGDEFTYEVKDSTTDESGVTTYTLEVDCHYSAAVNEAIKLSDSVEDFLAKIKSKLTGKDEDGSPAHS